MAGALTQRIQELESELKNLRKSVSDIHTSRLYQEGELPVEKDPLLNFIPDGITVLDQSGIILFVNKAGEVQYGEQAESLIGKPLTNFIASVDENTNYLPNILAPFSSPLTKARQSSVKLNDGRQFTFSFSFLVREDPLSGVKHLWMCHRDITSERLLEEEAKNSKERLDSLIETFPDIILNIDLTGTILFINPGSTYQNVDRMVGTSIYDHILPQDHETVRSAILSVFESGRETTCESSVIGMNGIVRWYTTRILPIKHDNHVIAATVSARDNSDKKEAEEELKRLKALMDSILNAIPGTLVVIDRRHNILASNLEDFRQKNIDNPHPKQKCYETIEGRKKPCNECQIKEVFRTGQPTKFEITDENDVILKEIRVFPVKNDSGVVRYAIEHIHNVSQPNPEMNNLGAADKSSESFHQLKTDFLSKISHELKTPMIGILGFSKLGIERYKKVTKEKLKSYFTTILESGEKLQNLLNNLLDLSQLEGGSMKYDFQEEKLSMITTIVLNELFTQLKENKIEVDYNKPNFPDFVSMDVDQVGKVIRNLVSNAIKYSKPSSRIEIDITSQEDSIQFAVTDTGEGIPEDELQLIFDKFSQSSRTKCNSGGQGLGLAISKKIITDHKGEIWAENRSLKGSVFKFKLPKV